MSTPQDPNGAGGHDEGTPAETGGNRRSERGEAADPQNAAGSQGSAGSQQPRQQPDPYGVDPYASAGYQSGHPQSGHPQGGYPQAGHAQSGHPQSGQHAADPYRSGYTGQQPVPSQYQSSQDPYVAQSPYGVQEAHPGQTKRSGFFKSLFDFRFDDFIAVRWAGIIYVITIVIAALSWIGTIISSIVVGVAASAATTFYSGDFYNDSPGFNPWPLIFAILLGWIVPLLWVIFVRLVLELVVSSVKTAEHTKRIADSVGR